MKGRIGMGGSTKPVGRPGRILLILAASAVIAGCFFQLGPGATGPSEPGGANRSGASSQPGGASQSAAASPSNDASRGAEPAGSPQPGEGSPGPPRTSSKPEPVPKPEPVTVKGTFFTVSVSPGKVDQGDLAVIRVSPAGSTRLDRVEISGLGLPARFSRMGNDFVALVGIPYTSKPAKRAFTVKAPAGGKEATVSASLEVTSKKFPEERLYVTKEQNDLLSDPGLDKDQEKVNRAKSSSVGEPLWTGPFLMPVDGEITTEYGLVRYVNDADNGRHSGLDIAAKSGTPVLAANNGRVVLAEKLILTGYTVIIDHGLGLMTSYNHLSRIDIAVGASVKKGQTVGAVGSTGFSMGPHLHWTVSVGTTPTNPRPLLKDGLLGR